MSAGKGMTLLEIMITVALLGVAMLSTLLAVTQAEQVAALSDDESLALQAAEQVMENLRAGDFSDLGNFSSLEGLRQHAAASGGSVGFTPCTAKEPSSTTAASETLLQPHVDAMGETLPVGIVEIRLVEAGGLTPVLVTIQWRGDDPKFPHTLTLSTKVAP